MVVRSCSGCGDSGCGDVIARSCSGCGDGGSEVVDVEVVGVVIFSI